MGESSLEMLLLRLVRVRRGARGKAELAVHGRRVHSQSTVHLVSLLVVLVVHLFKDFKDVLRYTRGEGQARVRRHAVGVGI